MLEQSPTSNNNLVSEAKKFKTADEFVKAQIKKDFPIKKDFNLGLTTAKRGELGKPIKTNANVEALKKEILISKQIKPIEITKDGFIVDGEHRYKVLMDLGVEDIPVFVGKQAGSAGRLERAYSGLMKEITIPVETESQLRKIREDANKSTIKPKTL